MKKTLAFLFVTMLLATAVMAQADQNVALNKPVTFYNALGVESGYAPSVTDGVWLSENAFWQNAFWWYNGSPYLVIDLGGEFTLTGFSVQADNNDSYRLSYRNAVGDWVSAWEVPYRTNGGGMSTRPNPGERYVLPQAVTTSWLKFEVTGGDYCYSVSEIQAYGSPSAPAVPEPAAIALAVGGLGAIVSARRRRA